MLGDDRFKNMFEDNEFARDDGKGYVSGCISLFLNLDCPKT